MNAIGWYYYNSDSETHPVVQKTPNAWGLYDMSGNVWEWCKDLYSSSYYDSEAMTDPTGPTSGSRRVQRGGSWKMWPRGCRSANRYGNRPYGGSDESGFRLLRRP